MGKIRTTTVSRFGIRRTTIVRTNQFEDFVINTIGKIFGKDSEWRLVHFIETRKLKKQ